MSWTGSATAEKTYDLSVKTGRLELNLLFQSGGDRERREFH